MSSGNDYLAETTELADIEKVADLVCRECLNNIEIHGFFNSAHELSSVLREEYEEFWDSVKRDIPDKKELIQIAAVAIAGIIWYDANYKSAK